MTHYVSAGTTSHTCAGQGVSARLGHTWGTCGKDMHKEANSVTICPNGAETLSQAMVGGDKGPSRTCGSEEGRKGGTKPAKHRPPATSSRPCVSRHQAPRHTRLRRGWTVLEKPRSRCIRRCCRETTNGMCVARVAHVTESTRTAVGRTAGPAGWQGVSLLGDHCLLSLKESLQLTG